MNGADRNHKWDMERPWPKKNPKKSRNKRGNLTKTRRWPTNRDKRSASSHWLVGPANGRWLWQNKQKTRRLPHRAIEMLFFFSFLFFFILETQKSFFFPRDGAGDVCDFFCLSCCCCCCFDLISGASLWKSARCHPVDVSWLLPSLVAFFSFFFCFALSFFFFFFPPLHHRVVPKFGSNLYWVLPGFPSLSGFTELYWVFTGLDWV